MNLTFNLTSDAADVVTQEEKVRESFGPMADRILAGTLLGTPDQAAERILRYREAGADGVNVALRAPWDEDAFAAYLHEVVPAVRKEVGG